jgi:chromosome segregation ATPase
MNKVEGLEHALEELEEQQSQVLFENEARQKAAEEYRQDCQKVNEHLDCLRNELRNAVAAKDHAESVARCQQKSLQECQSALEAIRLERALSQHECEVLTARANNAGELEALLEHFQNKNTRLEQDLVACQETRNRLKMELDEALKCAQAAESVHAEQAHAFEKLDSLQNQLGALQARFCRIYLCQSHVCYFQLTVCSDVQRNSKKGIQRILKGAESNC